MKPSTKATTISKILIANRGEIAVRIIHTLRKLDIQSVVVYHEADAGSLAVEEADESYPISGQTPVEAYLDGGQIIDACRTVGADALHPGYGFLSENAKFAQSVIEAGIIFIGPTPETIELMGDKIISRNFVAQNGFPLAPSISEQEDPESFAKNAFELGFPLLLKASAGGGGKGMHIVRTPGEFTEKAETARNEAQRYFGDNRLYCEPYLECPRHIEVQVLGDSHGNVIHLGERECSVQRRFQKIIEESPSPALSASQRKEICEAAAGIAKKANYLNAGTVEFIMDPKGNFYFLEMNTRLQVEHPVTECVTGIDLVAEQIRIACGEKLSIDQDAVSVQGHSIEARIYAEDADNDFLPAIGNILALHAPTGPGYRFDSGLRNGQEVTANFDPMLAKLIVHADTRQEAINRLSEALRDLVILGVTTNTAYLDRVIRHPVFESGDIHTGFVEQYAQELAPPAPDQALTALILSGVATRTPHFLTPLLQTPEPYRSMGHWRN
jgi:acetyl-CoA/propionyl-CoA/long-chain acyl-CoA carboxylase, biotin carboxylase, biotin carboxyl carrier protein